MERNPVSETGSIDLGACTLTEDEKPDRIARWRNLFEHSTSRRLADGEAEFQFENTAWVKSELDELVKLERICCAHVEWSLREMAGGLLLSLKAEPAALKTIYGAIQG